MRILFMGSGEIALPALECLLGSGHVVCGVVTQPDRPVGRHQEMRGPRTKEMAVAAGVPVLQPERLRRDGSPAEIVELAPDLIVVMAYGQILPKALLDLPPVGCINVHASLLPRHRGAACIQAPIDAGETESGLTIMHMAEGLDTGDVILRKRLVLEADETGGSLHDRMALSAPEVLMEAIRQLAAGTARRGVQDEALSSYAPKLGREDGALDWQRPAVELERRIRAFHPWPGTFTAFRDHRGRPRRLKIFPPAIRAEGDADPGTILEAADTGITLACGQESLILRELQADGGKRVKAREFLAGHPLKAGNSFFSLENGGKSGHA